MLTTLNSWQTQMKNAEEMWIIQLRGVEEKYMLTNTESNENWLNESNDNTNLKKFGAVYKVQEVYFTRG